jgi:Putative zinc-finger
MSNPRIHPDEATLVCLADGELPVSEAREIEQHLESCPACRTEASELRATVADCLRYRVEVLQPLLPPPPKPWADFDQLVAHAVTLPERRRPPVWRWALGAAAAILLIIGIVHQLGETPSVQAASLLRKAEAAAAARPVARRRLLIRTRSIQYSRLAGVAGTLPKEPAAPALEALFQRAHWDWNNPLSAQAFDSWRDLQSKKTDVVTRIADTVELRTVTPDGLVASASLTLQAADLLPIRSRLEFRDGDWVEMSEIPDAAPQSNSMPAPPRAAEPAPAPAESTSPALLPSLPETALLSSELQVLLKLHQMQADLGDPIDVIASNTRILVRGRAGLTPERQRHIQAAMEGIPHVAVEFSDATQLPASTPPPPAAAPETAPAGGLAARVEHQLGGHPQFERFSSQMLDGMETALAQAHALRNLADHFPPEREAQLEAADRRALRDMAREHITALSTAMGKTNAALNPVLGALGARGGVLGMLPTGPWQDTAQDILKVAQRIDRNLSVMLGAAPSDGTALSPMDMRFDLFRLDSDISRCQRLLSKD